MRGRTLTVLANNFETSTYVYNNINFKVTKRSQLLSGNLLRDG